MMSVRSDATTPKMAAAAVLGALSIALMWRVCVPSLIGDREGRAVAYLLPAIAIFCALSFLSPSFFFLLYILYPCVFALAATVRSAVGWALLLSLTASVPISYWDRWRLGDAALQGGGAFVFAVLTGLWILRIIEQSVERSELIESLRATREELADAQHAAGVRDERQRVAGEIHDTLAQGLASIVLLAQGAAASRARDGAGPDDRTLAMLGTIEQTARDNLAEARALVEAMRPAGLGGRHRGRRAAAAR